jgi:hypothetical protein
VIAEGNSLLFQSTEEAEPVRYGTGDLLIVEWDNDTCYVNGRIYSPLPPEAPKPHSVEALEGLYGRVPSVAEYVRSHSGDKVQLWNEAYRQWQDQCRLLVREAARQYTSAVESGKLPDAVADSVLVMLRTSPIVASARVDARSRGAAAPTRIIQVRFAGLDDEGIIMLSPHPILDVPAPRPMTVDEFKSLVQILRKLERKRPTTIELKAGSINLFSGPEALKRSGKS